MFLRPVSVKHFVSCSYQAEGPSFPYQFNEFGQWVIRPPSEKGHFHGLDLAVPYGSPVHAIANGMILAASYADPRRQDFGLGLRIRQIISAAGYDSWTVTYGFLQEVLVQPGQRVTAGDRIAYSGDSGSANGSKLRLILCNLTGQYRPIKFYDD